MRRDSRLLINESPLQVLPSLAVALGLNEALLLQQVHYWLTLTRHHHDDRPWVYNTVDQWQAQFPFWSKRTIERVLASLEKGGYLLVAYYNEHPWDRTKWYSIDYDAVEALPAAEANPPKWRDGDRPSGTMESAEVARSSSTEITTKRVSDDRLAHMDRALGAPRIGRR